MRRSLAASLCLSLLTAPSLLLAQTRVDGAPWRPELSVDPNALPYVEGTLVPGAGSWNFNATLEYVHNPLAVSSRGVTTSLIAHQVWTTLGVQLGLGSRGAVALQLPVLLFQEGDPGRSGAPLPETAGVGDARLLLRWSTRAEVASTVGRPGGGSAAQHAQSSTERREGFALGLNLALTAPLGGPSYVSAGAPTAHAFAVLDVRLARIIGAISVGYRARLDDRWPGQSGTCVDATSVACVIDTPLRDQFTWGVAIRQPLEGLIAGIALLARSGNVASAAILTGYFASTYLTLQGAVDARDPMGATNPLELGFGLQRQQGEWMLTAGASLGLTPAAGGGAPRVIASVNYSPRFIDEDHDGLRDDPAIDRCIGLPEDRDGFEDEDGCPEDNDQDAIPDEEDRCPTVNEDEDGFEDDDGCPDPDNDGDGVLDADDQCPDAAQSEHPDAHRRGCPSDDRDDDGVPNADDACVEVPQGDHPDPDRRGCPAPDGDGDGVADPADACPTEPSRNSPAEMRGCPDDDADRDGVPLPQDLCPVAQETLNGVADGDGCPETPVRPGAVIPGALTRVRVVRGAPDELGTVTLLQPITFGAGDAVTPASAPVLAQLAVALRAVTRAPDRWVELSVPTTPPAVTGPAAVDAARANRRRDAVIAALRALGVGERVLRAGEPAAPLRPGVAPRGVTLTLRVAE